MVLPNLEPAVAFLRKRPITYLATSDPAGPAVRAMVVAEVEDDGTIWYATGTYTNKVRQISKDPKVSISTWEQGKYLRVLGKAELVEDEAIKKKLWQDSWRTYFSGSDDPTLVLVKIKPDKIELWSSQEAARGKG